MPSSMLSGYVAWTQQERARTPVSLGYGAFQDGLLCPIAP